MPQICTTDLDQVIRLLRFSATILKPLPSTVCQDSARRITKIITKLQRIQTSPH